MRQAFSYLTENRKDNSPVSSKRQSTFASAKYKPNLGLNSIKTPAAAVESSMLTDRGSRTGVTSASRGGKRVAKGDRRRTMAVPSEMATLTAQAKKKMYMMGTTSFNNQIRQKQHMNSTIVTPRGSSTLLKSISMTKLSRPRGTVMPSSGQPIHDRSSMVLDKNKS